jgi:hypothetical protein
MSLPKKEPDERLTEAYERMLERAHRSLEDTGRSASALQHIIAEAKERAVELGELTREEADRIAAYVERDMHDAATFITDSGKGLADWLQFDLQYIEDRFLEMFQNVADKTRVELAALAHRAEHANDYHTGEVTGPGTLACQMCGQALHFHKTGHIPPCPKCKGTLFRRTPRSD